MNFGNMKFQNELISIIVPAFKAAGYIEHTIKSVIAQSYPHWEMLIANDCSPDNTATVAAHWSAQDSRIKLINLARNSGPAGARNAALEAAQGRWLAFLDSDDLWTAQKLELTLRFAQTKHAALAFTGFRRMTADGKQLGHYVSVPATLNYRQFLGNTAIATSTVLLDRQQCGDIRMQNVFYDDFVCWLGILKTGLTAHGLNEDLMRYRVIAQSVSRNKKRSAYQVWKTLRQIEKLNRLTATWHFVQYAVRGLLKYRKF